MKPVSPNRLNWSALQSFALVIETESLAGAASLLQCNQSTVSRHISALEDQLGVRLFERTATGLALTEPGRALSVHATNMLADATKLARGASGQSESLAGTVVVTASEAMSAYLLPPVITELQALQPNIHIDLVADDKVGSLLQRDADIGIRLVRPSQQDIIVKSIGEFRVGMFASKAYFDAHPIPAKPEDLLSHTVMCMNDYQTVIDGFRKFGLDIDADFFAFRSNSSSVNWQMIKNGFGIGFCHLQRGLKDHDLIQVLPEAPLPAYPVWLVSHLEMRTSKRLRYVFEFLASSVKDRI